MDRPGALELQFVAASDRSLKRPEGVLGGALFGGQAGEPRPVGSEPRFPVARVALPVLGGERGALEIWRVGTEVRAGTHGRVRYTFSQEILFGSLAIHEDEPTLAAAVSGERTRLYAATYEAYRGIFATLAEAGFPHLVRVWNYLPDITVEMQGQERYRQFNSARQEALKACGRAVAGNVPAASALGAASGSALVIYFLASRVAPTLIENPRQVSAYHYPEQYGPASPSFSRAAVLAGQHGATLFISGTASIVGHRTLHAGDPVAQTREALRNIEALLGEARTALGAQLALAALAYKVYIRDPRDLPAIRAALQDAIGPRAAALYLQADICRRDLAVEIEAVGRHAGGQPGG